jgi:hypothetical protein
MNLISHFHIFRTFTQMESYMVAVERINEYSKMEVEGASSADERRPPDSWPNMGCLTFDDVWMRYRYAWHLLASCFL